MEKETGPFINSKTSILLFIMSIVVALYFWLVQAINVYDFAFVGAIYEILWLPVILMLFVIPIISLIMLIKHKILFRSFYFYSILICVATFLIMVLAK